jgi:spermidine synthase
MFGFGKKNKIFISPINGEISIKKRYGRDAVLTGKITQSGGELIPMWKSMVSCVDHVSSVLVLGVGGGTVIKMIHDTFPKARLSGVEIDPVMLEIAKKHFDLKSVPVKLYTRDAVEWIRNHKEKYDLIVVDLFFHELNPPATRDERFFINLKKNMSPGGTIFYNAHFQKDNINEHDRFLSQLYKVFSSVDEVYAFPLNRLLALRLGEKGSSMIKKIK